LQLINLVYMGSSLGLSLDLRGSRPDEEVGAAHPSHDRVEALWLIDGPINGQAFR
jgi:hypothetical protein